MGVPITMEEPLGARMRINGRPVDYFCGTSYFCLHGHQEVIDAACAATREYGLGPGTLALMPIYAELKAALCAWFATEDVVPLISGYVSPMALLQGLRDDFDVVFVDQATHYSSRDAIAGLGKPVYQFRHLDANSLSGVLRLHLRARQRAVIVTDGVFPSTGALAPLADYSNAMAAYDNCLLCVDDSHGVGVLGQSGRGSLQHANLEQEGYYFSGTLSKAFGALGGIVPATSVLAEKIRQKSMVLRGASLPPPAAAAAAISALRLLKARPQIRADLNRNVLHLRSGLRKLGFAVADSPVPIVSLRGAIDLEHLRGALDKRDIVVKITPAHGYSDAPDMPTMRLAVFSDHSPLQIDRLLSAIRDVV